MRADAKKEEKQKRGESIINSIDFEKDFLELEKIAEKINKMYKEEAVWREKNLKEG